MIELFATLKLYTPLPAGIMSCSGVLSLRDEILIDRVWKTAK